MSMTPTDARSLPDAPAAAGTPGAAWLGRLRRHRHVTTALRVLPALLPALLFLPVVLAPPLNHDVAAVLDFSQRWLAGEHLYSDLIDVNPPLIFVLNLIPAWIASVTPLDGVQALHLCLLGYGGFCWWLAFRVRDRAAEAAVQRAFLDVLPALFLLDAGYDFGQREHLMAVGALPYVLCAARRSRGECPRGRIAVALTAGAAFALKPHFLGIPALIEFSVILARVPAGVPVLAALRAGLLASLRDPVPWVMVAVWAIYLASLPLVFPDYLGVVVPLVWDFYLDLGGLTVAQMLLLPRMATALCLLLPLLWLAFRRAPFRRPGPETALPRLLGLAAIGALASALAQHKGWSYHILPIELFACALGGVLAARWLDGLSGARFRPAAYPVAAILAGLFALYAISNGEAPWKELEYDGSQVDRLTQLLQQDAAGERVLVFSPGIYPIYPTLNYVGAHNTLRTMNMWLLQGAYQRCLPDGRLYREVWEMGRPEFFIYRTVAEDFARAPPAAVVVDRQPGIAWCGGEFSFIDYFKRHPLFAEVWSHYELSAEWDRYQVYTRKD